MSKVEMSAELSNFLLMTILTSLILKGVTGDMQSHMEKPRVLAHEKATFNREI